MDGGRKPLGVLYQTIIVTTRNESDLQGRLAFEMDATGAEIIKHFGSSTRTELFKVVHRCSLPKG